MEITKKPNIPQQTASVSNKNQADVTSWIKNNSFTGSKENFVKLVVLALLAFLLPFSVVVSSATYSKYDFFKKDQVTEGDVLGAGEAVCQEDKVCGMVGLGGCVARAECLENEFACGEGADMVCCDKGECQECSPCIDGFQAEANECGEVTKSCESVDCTGGVCGEVESVCYPVKYKVTYSTKEGKCPEPEEVCPGTANKAPECSSNTATVQEYTLMSGTCEGFDIKTGVCNEVVEDLEVGVVWEPMVLPKGSPLMGAKGGGQLGVLPAPHISSVSPTSYSFVGGGSMTINVSNIVDTEQFDIVASGGNHTCGIKSDGWAYCWGYNYHGQLGDGTNTNSSVPVKVAQGVIPEGVGLKEITAGSTHTCVIGTNDKAYCWGYGANGRLGNGYTSNRNTPVAVNTTRTFRGIVAGGGHTCAFGDIEMYCWGLNSSGQLGDGTTTQRTTPVQVNRGNIPAGTGLYSLTAGDSHTCVLDTGNVIGGGGPIVSAVSNVKAYCWGNNQYGQVGDGTTTTPKTTPVGVDMVGFMLPSSFRTINAGGYHTCAIGDNDVTYCWGLNNGGQLGDNSTNDASRPKAINQGNIPTGETLEMLSLGLYHSCAIASNAKAYCWGQGQYGQLGNSGTGGSYTPVAVSQGAIPTGIGIANMGTGSYHGCVRGSNGKLYCWGQNTYGKLGDGTTTTPRTSPVAVVDAAGANTYEINIGNNTLTRTLTPGTTSISVSPIPAHVRGTVSINIKRLTDGVLSNSVSFVYSNFPAPSISNVNPNTIGQAGGETVSITGSNFLDYNVFGSVVSISAGMFHSCAVQEEGAFCWGRNNYGQLGDRSINQRNTPVLVDKGDIPSGVSLSSISVGNYHTCGVGSNYKAYCWGYNNVGQLGDGGSVTSSDSPIEVQTSVTFKSISAGANHTCGISTNDWAYCWGEGTYGKLGNGGTANSSIPVAVNQGAILSGVSLISISAGANHTCAIGSNDWAYCWGQGTYGKLGNGGTAQSTEPVVVSNGGISAGTRLVNISAGTNHTCVIGANWAYCWGQGSYGKLGNGGTANSLVPVAVSQGAIPVGAGLGNISVGGNHTCAIGDGDIGVHCWGYNSTGQLGDGSNTQSLTPVFVLTGASSVIKQVGISSGSNHTCSVNYNGQAYCWGQGTYGKLGNDSTTNTPTMSYVLLKGLTPTIDFDTTPAASTTYTSTTSMSAVTPPLTASGTIPLKLTNPDGQYATYNITVKAPPSAPQNLTATAGNKQVVLSWTAPSSPGSSPITDYIVEYSTDNSTWTVFNDGTSTNTTATVTGLTNGTLYYFRVAAVNTVGTGKESNTATATPFNAAPVFSAISNNSPSGTPKNPGDSITWNATAYDPDSNQVKLVVCDSQGITGSTCNGTELCSSSLVASNPSCSHTATPPYTAGPHDAYVYVFDGEGLAASGGVHNTNSVFYIKNVAPSVLSVTINSGNAITLLESTTTSIAIKTQIESNNGCQSIGTVTAYLYRSGKGYSHCNTGAHANNNYCYSEISCIRDAGECTAPYGKTAKYTCTATIWYYADPTDNNTVYSSENWLATVKALGGGGTVGSAQSSTGVEMNSLIAFDVTSTLNYGDLLVSEVTDPLSKVLTTTATGNVGINQNHSGVGMGMCVDYNDPHNPCSVGTPIGLAQQKYSTSASTSYTDPTNAKTLTSTPTLVQLKIPKVTSTPTSANTWWGISIPSNTLSGSYEGCNMIQAVKSNIADW